MRRSVAGSGLLSPLAIAGWLFADMLLVFALVALGNQPDLAPSRPVAQAAVPSPTVPVKPAGPRAVEKKGVEVNVSGDPDDQEALVTQIRNATGTYEGREAAMVLTFGGGGNPGVGQAYAHSVNRLLAVARPEMFTQTTTRDFHNLSSPSGSAELEIYFYTHTS